MNLKTGIVFFGLLLIFGFQEKETAGESKVQWLTFEEAIEKSRVEKKKIFIDVYTDWCGWCKVMDRETFNHDIIAKYLNDNFYPVKLDAEQKEPISFNDKTFEFVPQGKRGYHELAAALLNGKMSYPTVVFLDENFNMLQPLPGYHKPKFFDMVLRYIGDDHFKKTKWEEFQKNYNSPI